MVRQKICSIWPVSFESVQRACNRGEQRANRKNRQLNQGSILPEHTVGFVVEFVLCVVFKKVRKGPGQCQSQEPRGRTGLGMVREWARVEI